MANLTRKQQEIYNFILSFTTEHGYPPSVREIGSAVGLKSPSTVHFHMKGLEEAGVIIKAEGKTRAISLPGASLGLAAEAVSYTHLTGRHRSAIGAAADRFPFDGYITLNGQYCFAGGQVLRSNPIPPDSAAHISRILEHSGIPAILLEETDTYTVNPGPCLLYTSGVHAQLDVQLDSLIEAGGGDCHRQVR